MPEIRDKLARRFQVADRIEIKTVWVNYAIRYPVGAGRRFVGQIHNGAIEIPWRRGGQAIFRENATKIFYPQPFNVTLELHI